MAEVGTCCQADADGAELALVSGGVAECVSGAYDAYHCDPLHHYQHSLQLTVEKEELKQIFNVKFSAKYTGTSSGES